MEKILSALRRFFALILAFFASLPGFSRLKPAETQPEPDVGIRNVIFMIGDGMGFLHLEKTKQERGITLTMDTFPVQGASRTRSASSDITDSAAGATALSCGVRTKNSAVGVYIDDLTAQYSYPKSITEACHENGMRVGIVTTDEVYGATPAGFAVHTDDRDNKTEIVEKELLTPFDLIWGDETGRTDRESVEAAGFTMIESLDEMNALEPGERSFGLFAHKTWHLADWYADPENEAENTPRLDQMAVKAADLLSRSAGKNGFFLMVEGAHIDKRSHDNDDAEMCEALEEFDITIRKMLEFAKADGHTLVIVTADHETGGITLDEEGRYAFTRTGHSDADVPVLVYGSDEIIADGETVDNTELPIRVARVLGLSEEQFPYTVLVPQQEALPEAA